MRGAEQRDSPPDKPIHKGRTFSCDLGHPKAMNGLRVQALMLRGTEWAAKGR